MSEEAAIPKAEVDEPVARITPEEGRRIGMADFFRTALRNGILTRVDPNRGNGPSSSSSSSEEEPYGQRYMGIGDLLAGFRGRDNNPHANGVENDPRKERMKAKLEKAKKRQELKRKRFLHEEKSKSDDEAATTAAATNEEDRRGRRHHGKKKKSKTEHKLPPLLGDHLPNYGLINPKMSFNQVNQILSTQRMQFLKSHPEARDSQWLLLERGDDNTSAMRELPEEIRWVIFDMTIMYMDNNTTRYVPMPDGQGDLFKDIFTIFHHIKNLMLVCRDWRMYLQTHFIHVLFVIMFALTTTLDMDSGTLFASSSIAKLFFRERPFLPEYSCKTPNTRLLEGLFLWLIQDPAERYYERAHFIFRITSAIVFAHSSFANRINYYPETNRPFVRGQCVEVYRKIDEADRSIPFSHLHNDCAESRLLVASGKFENGWIARLPYECSTVDKSALIRRENFVARHHEENEKFIDKVVTSLFLCTICHTTRLDDLLLAIK